MRACASIQSKWDLPHEILKDGNLISEVFENCITDGNYEGMKDRVTLAPRE